MRNAASTKTTKRVVNSTIQEAMDMGWVLNKKYHIVKTERSAHNETIQWNAKKRMQILEQIFGFELTDWGKATINLSEPWMISDISTHYSRPIIQDKKKWAEYSKERIAIKHSCDYQRAIINRMPVSGTMPMYNRQVYARIIDLPDNRLLLNILKDMKKNGCADYEAYKVFKLGEKEARKFQGGRPTDIEFRQAKYQEAIANV